MISGYEVLGSLQDLAEIVKKNNVNEAYIALGNASKKELREIYDQCQELH